MSIRNPSASTVLRLNALSCFGFGAVMAALPGAISVFLGDAPVMLVRLLGIGLVVQAAHLLWVSRQVPSVRDLAYFAAGDGLWVVASVVLVLSGIWITTPTGIAAVLAIAVFVAWCGFHQWRHAAALAHRARTA